MTGYLFIPKSSILMVRRSFFSSPWSAAFSLLSLVIIILVAWSILDWAVFSAVFSTKSGVEACKDASGACWSVISAQWRLIMFGLYPYGEQWRSGVACVLAVVMVVLSCIPRFWTFLRLTLIWSIGGVTFFILLRGGVFGLTEVSQNNWGGLTLTLFIFLGTAILGLPLALSLALLRRSKLPWISRPTGIIVDTVRSLPLVTILLAFAVMVPLVVPNWLSGIKLNRAIVGNALYFAAYQAEIIRGGMQIIPSGQQEAAKSLGLGYWHCISRILLPQAFKNALPATINQFVITFKETALFIIIGLFELLASGNAAFESGRWSFAYIEVYIFVGLIYFVFVFSLSRYGAFLERRLARGRK